MTPKMLKSFLYSMMLATFLLCCITGVPLLAESSQEAKAGKSDKQSPKIVPSIILSDLQKRKQSAPEITPKELAEYANALLTQKGFNYDFDACEIIESNGKSVGRTAPPSGLPETFSYKMKKTDGEEIAFQIISNDNEGGGMCAECFFQIPALQVTKKEILVLAEGKHHQLKRPKAFILDYVELMDETMQNVSRTWQLPFQTAPIGISPDGSKLYLECYYDQDLDELVLELSEDGKLQFKPRSDVDLRVKGEWIENLPKDLENSDLSFMRFYVGNRAFIIRFTPPCT